MKTVYGYEYCCYDSHDCNFTSEELYATKTQNKDAMWKVASELIKDYNTSVVQDVVVKGVDLHEAISRTTKDGRFHISIVDSGGNAVEGITEIVYTVTE